MKQSETIYRLLRIAQNRSIKSLAEELNISSAYINSIEKGKRQPAKRLLKDYAAALNVTPEYIHTFVIPDDEPFEMSLLRVLLHLCDMEVSP